jgi:hypothetical protein
MRRFVLQEVVEASGRKVLCFIKLHAPWPVLCHYAEELNMRAPLQVSKSPFRPLYFSRLRCLSAGVKDMCARKCVFHPLYYIYMQIGPRAHLALPHRCTLTTKAAIIERCFSPTDANADIFVHHSCFRALFVHFCTAFICRIVCVFSHSLGSF